MWSEGSLGRCITISRSSNRTEGSLRLVRVRLEHSGLEVNGQSGGVVRSGQVVQRRLPLGLLRHHPGVLLDGQHVALVADGVHRVLVRVRRLEEPALQHT